MEDIIFTISLSPVLLLPWVKLQRGVTHQVSWECSCLGSEWCSLCLEMVDYCLLTRPCWNQPLDISKKWVILYSNAVPAQIQASAGRASKSCPWRVIAHWMRAKRNFKYSQNMFYLSGNGHFCCIQSRLQVPSKLKVKCRCSQSIMCCYK